MSWTIADISNSLADEVAQTLIQLGHLTDATTIYRALHKRTQAAVERDPSNTEWQRDLSVSHDKIGDMLAAQGNATEALAAYRQGMGIREALAERDPSNTAWQRDLIISNMKMAELGDEPAQRYRSALAIAHELKRTDRLQPIDEWMVPELERRLQEADI